MSATTLFRARLTWHPYTEVNVIGQHGPWLWAVDDSGDPYTLRGDAVERVPAAEETR